MAKSKKVKKTVRAKARPEMVATTRKLTRRIMLGEDSPGMGIYSRKGTDFVLLSDVREQMVYKKDLINCLHKLKTLPKGTDPWETAFVFIAQNLGAIPQVEWKKGGQWK